jgi:hypothetical protein
VGTGGIGKVSLHTIWAGSGENSGRISTDANLASLIVDQIAGPQTFTDGVAGKSAAGIGAGGKIGSITVAGNVSGGIGDGSGRIAAGVSLGKISIGGHLIGGAGAGSGQIIAGQNLGTLTIDGAQQEYVSIEATAGGAGVQEKQILKLGDVLGRSVDFTLTYFSDAAGSVFSDTTLNFTGASTAADIQAALNALPSIGADGVSVAIVNGTLEITFSAEGDQPGKFSANVKQATIVGAGGNASGSIASNGTIAKITIKNLSGASAALKAGNGTQSGGISSLGNAGTILIDGDLDAMGSASLSRASVISVCVNLVSLTLNGCLRGGSCDLTGAVGVD